MELRDEAEKDDIETGELDSDEDMEPQCAPDDVPDDPEETEQEITAEVLFADNFLSQFGGEAEVLAGNPMTQVLGEMSATGWDDVVTPDTAEYLTTPAKAPSRVMTPELDNMTAEDFGDDEKGKNFQAVSYAVVVPALMALVQNEQGVLRMCAMTTSVEINVCNTNEYSLLGVKSVESVALVGLAVGKERFANNAKEIVQVLVRVQSSEELEGHQAHIQLNIQRSDVADDDVEEDGQMADGKDTMTLRIRDVDKKHLEINTSALVDKISAYNMLYQSAFDLEGWFDPTRLAGGQVTRAVRECCWVGLFTSEEGLIDRLFIFSGEPGVFGYC
ncbi:importin-like protein [Phytophthora cinnamomi]|uniref:importin-like protein n=1 Tax=Phytophthora cinnamomi TaxID=4785 RepID=UPI00355A1449|nr:importin-like protein [Phytophthora cinnamomi]